MRVKKVNRYYCDFCKKAGCSAGHMRKHEAACTNNPGRVCGMCKVAETLQAPMSVLLDCLPERPWEADWVDPVTRPLVEKELEAGLALLRKKAENCPACIAAALRQRGIVWWMAGFDFKEECAAFWKTINETNADNDYRGSMY